MKASEFREQFDAELERARPRRRRAVRETAVVDSLAEITNRRLGVRRRVEAVGRAAENATRQPQVMETLIALMTDTGEKVELRRAALAAVQASTFKTLEFRRWAADYNDALRVVATDDDADLRAQSLDVLALNKDPYAQQLLLDGLQDPSRALVKPVQAVRMLGYDVHAEHYPVLRQIVEETKKPVLRREALRVLAADSGSVDLMRGIAADRREDKQARATATIALQSLAPEEFTKVARDVVLDDDEDHDFRASVITALARRPRTVSRDVVRKVREIDAAPGGNRSLNRAARDFTQRQ